MTGDGEPDIVIEEWSGGAHCCMTSHMFQIGEKFRLIVSIAGGHSSPVFRDITGDGIPEVFVLSWYGPYCDIPPEEIIHTMEKGQYREMFIPIWKRFFLLLKNWFQ